MWSDNLGAPKPQGSMPGSYDDACLNSSGFGVGAGNGSWPGQGLGHGGCCSNGACDISLEGNGGSAPSYSQGSVGSKYAPADSRAAQAARRNID